mmetsp:Transcript_6633/g.4974  ORF Transcript_6633/g.4974 Transcript_6633/m.4974 type:complete len:92 (+) Transcript_6633:169-444(+)
MMVVKSLKSKGLLTEVFNWQWAYYFITNKGVAYLAKQLNLPSDIVPNTFKKKKIPGAARAKGEDDDEKPARPETEGETARPGGLGRGRGSR